MPKEFGCSGRLCSGAGDNRATAAAVRRMGAEAMGVDATNVPSNLMLDYVERKMPVGDQKLLALVASFAASGWRAARDEGNVSLESWMSKLLVFCDQCSVEGHPAVRSVDPKRLDVSEFGLRQGDGLPRGPARGGNFNLRHGLKRSTVAPATGGGGPGCTEEAAKAAAAKTSGARRRDFVSRSLPACETSDANSGVSIPGRAEPCSNSVVNDFSGPRGSSSRRVRAEIAANVVLSPTYPRTPLPRPLAYQMCRLISMTPHIGGPNTKAVGRVCARSRAPQPAFAPGP